MIPILYEKDETAFTSNGLGRLRDCISAVVTEERNGIYEFDFEYPIYGANYELIQVGRIVAVTHDDTGDIEPFDIISYSKPINGIVTFHCVHISYRLSYCTVTGSNINSLADAFTLFETAEPNMPFSFQTDKTSSSYMAAADGKPRTVRELMGGVEGSILDTYGGEYAFNNWTVYLYSARGQARNLTIRYGVNMLDYNEDYDASGTFSSVVPYWTDGTAVVLGDRVDGMAATITGRGETVPLDVSDKFESKPTKAQVEAEATAYLSANNTTIPKQTIKIEFVRLQDLGFDWLDNLLTCELCDTINVVFPDYNSSGRFKIVKTVWDVLGDRFESMELGELSTTLSEALGITNGLGGGGGSGAAVDYVVTQNKSGDWSYRIWASGKKEAWLGASLGSLSFTRASYRAYLSYTYPTACPITFTSPVIIANARASTGSTRFENVGWSGNKLYGYFMSDTNSTASGSVSYTNVYLYAYIFE